MNGVKSGFTTLNRLLGKKNKESSLSKSSSNLSRSMSQLPTTGSSQPQNTYNNINSNNNNNVDNKILPLQSMSNAPFEQTFRITVQLPRDQLYVARLGAKTPLVVLLKMVCDDKQLDMSKYEFRHPGDMSQAYDNDCTIGFVGLNELKLVLKTEKYQNGNFNTEEIVKLRNGGGINLASSNNNGSNNSTKTSLVSPYSSTNSLNSIDSSGMMSTSSRGGSIVGPHPPIPPSRKKRAAPRPPSQNSIPENKNVNINNNNNNSNYSSNNNNNIKEFKSPLPPTIEDTMPIKKTFHVSSPNLVSNFSITTNHTNGTYVKDIYDDTTTNHDYNHNIKTNGQDNRYNSANDLRRVESTMSHQRPMSMQIPYQTSTSNRSSISSNTINMNEPSTIINHSRTSSESSEQNIRDGDKPEPIPRRRLFSGSKKKAPAPQPRGLPPVPTPRFLHESKEKLNTVELNQHNEIIKNNVNVKKDQLVAANVMSAKAKIMPAPIDDEKNHPIAQNGNVPTTIADRRDSLTLENKKLSITSNGDCKNVPMVEHRPVSPVAPPVKEPIVTNGKRQSFESDKHSPLNSGNVSKVMLNVEEKQRIEEPIIMKSNVDNKPLSNSSSRNSSISVNANAEPNQNSIETSSVISSDADDNSMTESPKIKMESSDDDVDKDKMKIYNLKLGTSVTKTSTRDDSLAANVLTSVENEDITPEVVCVRSQSPLWTYTLPAPANFADPSDTSSIAVMDNSTIIRDDLSSVPDNLTIISDSTIGSELRDEIIKPIIHDNHIVVESDEIIRNNSDIEDGYHGGDLEKSRKLSQESLKKNLHNETIENRKNHVIEELSNVINENTLEKLISTRHLSSHDDGILVNSSLTNFKMATYQPTPNEDAVEIKRSSITKSISRSDSFHTTRIEATVKTTELSLPRSSSQMSLNETTTARRKSSCSLHESPSLQSLEVMKMILPGLNSANSSKRNSINVNEDDAMLKSLANKRSSISDEVVSSPLKRHSREDIRDKIEQKRESIKEDEKPITTAKIIEEPNSVVEPEKVGTKQTSTTEEEDESTNKKWKYQGPPAINFSSWAERPKVQVAIKSDRDYKFGGGGANNRVSDEADPIVEHNNNRNQKERKLPIVRSVEYKKPVVIPLNQEKEELKSSPPIVLRPKPEIVNKPNFYQTFSRPNTIHINGNYNNSTSNKFTPFVRGFKTENVNTNSNAVSIESIVNIPKKSKENVELANKNVNTNSTTTTKISNNNTSSGNTLPFGQNTLRRTGLKEKILLTENPMITRRPSSEIPAQQIHLKQQETVVKSTTIVNDMVVDNGNSHKNNISSTNNPVIKSNIRNVAAADVPPPPPPVPKLAPVVRAAVIKKSNPVIDDDPRDQLLTAIKSFNRGTLKRS